MNLRPMPIPFLFIFFFFVEYVANRRLFRSIFIIMLKSVAYFFNIAFNVIWAYVIFCPDASFLVRLHTAMDFFIE